MSQDNLVKMKCTECEEPNYFTRKNMAKAKGEHGKLELKKHCPRCETHVLHREGKKSK